MTSASSARRRPPPPPRRPKPCLSSHTSPYHDPVTHCTALHCTHSVERKPGEEKEEKEEESCRCSPQPHHHLFSISRHLSVFRHTRYMMVYKGPLDSKQNTAKSTNKAGPSQTGNIPPPYALIFTPKPSITNYYPTHTLRQRNKNNKKWKKIRDREKNSPAAKHTPLISFPHFSFKKN